MMGCLATTDSFRMELLASAETAALRRLLESQPTTPAKVTFAWRMAAGSALGRAADASWREDGALVLRASSDAWRRELRVAAPVLIGRLSALLGQGVVTRLEIL